MPDPAGIRIRAARIGEARRLSELALRSKAHWSYTAEQIKRWREDLRVTPLQIRKSLVQVAELDGVVAGFFVLEGAAPDSSLEHFWVLPAMMGRGVGRALLARAAALAAAGGASAILIDADPHAEAFYQACGAIRVGTLAAPIDGQPERLRPQLRLSLREAG